ncbi:hypothetical protein [Aureimonas psammosilenae]|uniref:hypothetical protein n=1 Tax=Aureimonas psammosilenae TaxID=2495496 RepID=UPI001F1FC5B0|nr:hypothetical protein [Aureimonas psammosilenae]
MDVDRTEGWARRRRYSGWAAILAAVTALMGTISLAFTLADGWPREGNRSALALWLLVLPVACWIGGWTGFIAREAKVRAFVLALACAAAGAGLFLRPAGFLASSLGEFGLTVFLAGASLFLRRSGLRKEEERLGEDGLGQSLADDLRWARRFREARRLALPWRAPSAEDDRRIRAHPTMGRFADAVVALADWESRRWIVMERDWHGWPDPERYVLFVLEGETIWLARDFDRWPSGWSRPAA